MPKGQSIITLYAVWLMTGYKVNYVLTDQNDFYGEHYLGYIDDNLNGIKHIYGEQVTALQETDTHNAHREGYNFAGWKYYTDKAGAPVNFADFGATFEMPNYEITLEPNWRPISYTCRSCPARFPRPTSSPTTPLTSS